LSTARIAPGDMSIPDSDGHNACTHPTQTKIVELLREVHLIAFRKIERLNMRIVELENQNRQFL
jgi:hypothetical protein